MRKSIRCLVDIEQGEQVTLIIENNRALSISGNSVIVTCGHGGRKVILQGPSIGYLPFDGIYDGGKERIALHAVDEEKTTLIPIRDCEVLTLSVDTMMRDLLGDFHPGTNDYLAEGFAVEAACIEHGLDGSDCVFFGAAHPEHAGMACMVQAITVSAPHDDTGDAGALYNGVRVIFLNGSANL